MRQAMILIAAALALAACATQGPGSLTGTVAGTKNLHTPEFAVCGKTAYDQRWINVTTEAMVDGFGQPRPKPRPASLGRCGQAKKMVVKAPVVAPAATPAVAPAVKPKGNFWWKKKPAVAPPGKA